VLDAFAVPLAWLGERAERQHDDSYQWSPGDAPASEGKFLEATLYAIPLKDEPPPYLRPCTGMLKMPPSAFVEAAVDGSKLRAETRNIGIEFFEVNLHERRSRDCCGELLRPKTAFGSQKKQLALAVAPGPMSTNTRRRGVGKAGIDE
jgi:hypothetical protein